MNDTPVGKRRFGCLHVLLFVLGAVLVTAVVCFFVFKAFLFPRAFTPVTLNAREEAALQVKVDQLDVKAVQPARTAVKHGALAPEPYSEQNAGRTIRFTEKELNALLAKHTDLADKAAIDLSPGLVSARLRIPVDEDVPVIGGKTLRVKAGVSFTYADGKPVVMLTGVTVMGIALPNAWLGGMKDVDLIQQAGGHAGFWKAFSDGVESLRVEDGCVVIQLKK